MKKKYTDLIFISIGTNDRFHALTEADTRNAYVSMIEQIKESAPDCDIVFVLCARDFELRSLEGMTDGEISPFIHMMLEVADEYGLSVIDPMSALYDACTEAAPSGIIYPGGVGWSIYMQDEVHPNAEGQKLYGRVVFAHFMSALGE